eukprot:Rmarinus@m.4183
MGPVDPDCETVCLDAGDAVESTVGIEFFESAIQGYVDVVAQMMYWESNEGNPKVFGVKLLQYAKSVDVWENEISSIAGAIRTLPKTSKPSALPTTGIGTVFSTASFSWYPRFVSANFPTSMVKIPIVLPAYHCPENLMLAASCTADHRRSTKFGRQGGKSVALDTPYGSELSSFSLKSSACKYESGETKEWHTPEYGDLDADLEESGRTSCVLTEKVVGCGAVEVSVWWKILLLRKPFPSMP